MRAFAPIAGSTRSNSVMQSRMPTNCPTCAAAPPSRSRPPRTCSCGRGRSVVRKVLEFPLALWIDLVLGKRRTMEIYLNIAEWGPNGEFGAEAAARHAFGKSARDLTAREAATLAAVLPNPARRSAQKPGPGVRRLSVIYQSRAAKSAGVS